MSLHPRGLSYQERAARSDNQATKAFLELVARKQTNLSIAADVRTKAELLHIADTLGPYMCLLKTHIDTLDDFDIGVTRALAALAEKHQFMIFEDRKFADIGNTVKHQYGDGVYKISSWSHITNAHTVPGPGIIEGLKEVGAPLGRGLLLLAEMSSKGTLAKGQYSQDTIAMAKEHADFVMGFISMRRLVEQPDFVYMSPGVNLSVSGDGLGQQYNTPHKIIYEQGSDIIIVGRGIYEAPNPVEMAQKYRDAGWKAYLDSLEDTKKASQQ